LLYDADVSRSIKDYRCAETILLKKSTLSGGTSLVAFIWSMAKIDGYASILSAIEVGMMEES